MSDWASTCHAVCSASPPAPPTHAELLRFLDDFTSGEKAVQTHNVERLHVLLSCWAEFTLAAMLSIFCNQPLADTSTTSHTTTAATGTNISNSSRGCIAGDGGGVGASHALLPQSSPPLQTTNTAVAHEGHVWYTLRQRLAAATVLRRLLRDQLDLTRSRSHDHTSPYTNTRQLRWRDQGLLCELLPHLMPMTACVDAEEGARPAALCNAASDLIVLLLRLDLRALRPAAMQRRRQAGHHSIITYTHDSSNSSKRGGGEQIVYDGDVRHRAARAHDAARHGTPGHYVAPPHHHHYYNDGPSDDDAGGGRSAPAVWPNFLRTLQRQLVQLRPYLVSPAHILQTYNSSNHNNSCDSTRGAGGDGATTTTMATRTTVAAQAALLGLARLLRTLCEDAKVVRQGIRAQSGAEQEEGIVLLPELLRELLHDLRVSLSVYPTTVTTSDITTSNTAAGGDYELSCPAGWAEEYVCGLVTSVLDACTACLDDGGLFSSAAAITTCDAKGNAPCLPTPAPFASSSSSLVTGMRGVGEDEEEEGGMMPASMAVTAACAASKQQPQPYVRYTTTTNATTITTSVSASHCLRLLLRDVQDTLVHGVLPLAQTWLRAGRQERAGTALAAAWEAMRAVIMYVPHRSDAAASGNAGGETRDVCEAEHHVSTMPLSVAAAAAASGSNDVVSMCAEEVRKKERAAAQVGLLRAALPVVLLLWQLSTTGSSTSDDGGTHETRQTSLHHTSAPLATTTTTTTANDASQQRQGERAEDGLVSHPRRERAVQASLLFLTSALPCLSEAALACVAEWVPAALSTLHGLSALPPALLAQQAAAEDRTWKHNTTNNNNSNNNNNNSGGDGQAAAGLCADRDHTAVPSHAMSGDTHNYTGVRGGEVYGAGDGGGGRGTTCQTAGNAVHHHSNKNSEGEEEEEGFPLYVVEPKRERRRRGGGRAAAQYASPSAADLIRDEDEGNNSNNDDEEEEHESTEADHEDKEDDEHSEDDEECDGWLPATQHARRQGVNWLLNALLSSPALARVTRHTLLQCSYAVLCTLGPAAVPGGAASAAAMSITERYTAHATLEAAMMMLNETAEAMLRLPSCAAHASESACDAEASAAAQLLGAITTAVMQLLNGHLRALASAAQPKTHGLPHYLGAPCVRWLTRLTRSASRVVGRKTPSGDPFVTALAAALLAAVNGLSSLLVALVTLLGQEPRSEMQVEVVHAVQALLTDSLRQLRARRDHHHEDHGSLQRGTEEGDEDDVWEEGSEEERRGEGGAESELETESDSEEEEKEKEEEDGRAERNGEAETRGQPPRTPRAAKEGEDEDAAAAAATFAALSECLNETVRCLPRLRPAARAALYELLIAVLPEWEAKRQMIIAVTVVPQAVVSLPHHTLEALARRYNCVAGPTRGSPHAGARRVAERAALLNCLCEVVPEVGGGVGPAVPWLIGVCAAVVERSLTHVESNDECECESEDAVLSHGRYGADMGAESGVGSRRESAAAHCSHHHASPREREVCYQLAGVTPEDMCMLAVDLLGAVCDAVLDRQQLIAAQLLHTPPAVPHGDAQMRANALYEALATCQVSYKPHKDQGAPCLGLLWDAVLEIVRGSFAAMQEELRAKCDAFLRSGVSCTEDTTTCEGTAMMLTTGLTRRTTTFTPDLAEGRMHRSAHAPTSRSDVGPELRRACFSFLYDTVFLRTTVGSWRGGMTEKETMDVSDIASACVCDLQGPTLSPELVARLPHDGMTGAQAKSYGFGNDTVRSAAMLCLAEVLHRCCVQQQPQQRDNTLMSALLCRVQPSACGGECDLRQNEGAGARYSSASLSYAPHSQSNDDDHTPFKPLVQPAESVPRIVDAMATYGRLYKMLIARYCDRSSSNNNDDHNNNIAVSSAHAASETSERRNALLLITALHAFLVCAARAVVIERGDAALRTYALSSPQSAHWGVMCEADTRLFLRVVVAEVGRLFAVDKRSEAAANKCGGDVCNSCAPHRNAAMSVDYECVQVWWNVGVGLTQAYELSQRDRLCDRASLTHGPPLSASSMWADAEVVRQLRQACVWVYQCCRLCQASPSAELRTLWRPLARHVCACDETGGGMSMGCLSATERELLSW